MLLSFVRISNVDSEFGCEAYIIFFWRGERKIFKENILFFFFANFTKAYNDVNIFLGPFQNRMKLKLSFIFCQYLQLRKYFVLFSCRSIDQCSWKEPTQDSNMGFLHLCYCQSPRYIFFQDDNSNFLDGLPTSIFSYTTNLPTACFPYYGQKRLLKKAYIDAFRIKNKIQIFITVFSVLHSSLKIHVFSLLSFPLNLK